MSFKFKVLSIDGGGIRGIIPAVILAEIEKRTGKRIFELFDMIAGTSTGGILALGLTKPNPDKPNETQYTAQELIELYRGEQGRRIFHKQEESGIDQFLDGMLKKILTHFHLPNIDPDDLGKPKYLSDGREEILTDYLGDTLLKNALTEVFITSYDSELRQPIFFTSNRQAEKIGNNFRKLCNGFTMKQAAMASSAAPTYFAPYQISTSHHGTNGFYTLVDGGVFANNPASLAVMEAIITSKQESEKLDIDEILVVSLGTGSLTRKYPYKDAKNWGLIGWVEPLIHIGLDGASESVACQLEQLLPKAEDKPKQYYRFQAELAAGKGSDDLDDVSEENIKNLENLAREIMTQNGDFDELCEQLSSTITAANASPLDVESFQVA